MAGSAEEMERARLAAMKGKARHPVLGLWNFVADLKVLPDVDEISEDDVPEKEREDAELRRAALIVAATDIVDWCIDDIEMVMFGEDGQADEETTEESFVFDVFPGRHRRSYRPEFFRKVLVTAVKVASDLADPHGGPAACTAEEIIRHAAGRLAMSLCEEAGLGRPWLDPDELLLEDADFELLYAEEMDGLEDDPGAQRALGIDLPSVKDWFSPFNPDRAVHPYAETASTAPEVHDLYPRLGHDDDPAILFDPAVVDDAAPITGFPAGSGIVALLRQSAPPVPGQWVADESDPEASFTALAAASAADHGSGGWTGRPTTVRALPAASQSSSSRPTATSPLGTMNRGSTPPVPAARCWRSPSATSSPIGRTRISESSGSTGSTTSVCPRSWTGQLFRPRGVGCRAEALRSWATPMSDQCVGPRPRRSGRGQHRSARCWSSCPPWRRNSAGYGGNDVDGRST